MKKIIGLGAIGGFIFGIIALILGLTLFSVILIFGAILMALAFILYYTRAIPLTIFDRINDMFKPKRRRRRWPANLGTVKLMQNIFAQIVQVISAELIQ